MQPHEWANQITRSVDSDIRLLDTIIDKYQELKDIANELRNLPFMESNANRKVDDTSVALGRTSNELDRINSAIGAYCSDLRAVFRQ